MPGGAWTTYLGLDLGKYMQPCTLLENGSQGVIMGIGIPLSPTIAYKGVQEGSKVSQSTSEPAWTSYFMFAAGAKKWR